MLEKKGASSQPLEIPGYNLVPKGKLYSDHCYLNFYFFREVVPYPGSSRIGHMSHGNFKYLRV